MISQQKWSGLSPNRFPTNRKHFLPQGQINSNIQPSFGRRHFHEKYDIPISYKPGLKVFPEHGTCHSFDMYEKGYNNKKLIYVPAQKRSKPIKIKLIGVKKESGVKNMNWKDKEKIVAHLEDEKTVDDLKRWEKNVLIKYHPGKEVDDE